jgi:DNA-binding MarR family transcriptional regulator
MPWKHYIVLRYTISVDDANPARWGPVGNGRVEIDSVIRDLAQFRYALRKFLRFSQDEARRWGVTPQQHQLMLGIAGYCGRGSATISELAEFLQERVHSVVGLVERAQLNGLVQSKKSHEDHRVVVVSLTRRGETILSRLSRIHEEELKLVKDFLGVRQLSKSLPCDRR